MVNYFHEVTIKEKKNKKQKHCRHNQMSTNLLPRTDIESNAKIYVAQKKGIC